MTKTELTKEVAKRLGMTEKSVAEVTDCLLEVVTSTLENGEPVRLTGFGTFERKERAARTGVNPATKEQIAIPATYAAAFKAGKDLKDRVAKDR